MVQAASRASRSTAPVCSNAKRELPVSGRNSTLSGSPNTAAATARQKSTSNPDHRPSPFCLLDEVEAALDEANVIRLVDLVRDLTTHSQFILITHNKRTMSMADVLYGVTMQEPGVSKLVSVRLRKDEPQSAPAVA